MTRKKPEPAPAPEQPEAPEAGGQSIHFHEGDPPGWFSMHAGVSFEVGLAWIFAVTVGAGLACVGSPDLIDGVIAWLSR